DDERRALLGHHHLAPDDVGGRPGAAGAVDAQHDGLDVGVLARLPQRLRHRIRTRELPAEGAALALAGDDVAHGVHEGDLRAVIEPEPAALPRVFARRERRALLEAFPEL